MRRTLSRRGGVAAGLARRWVWAGTGVAAVLAGPSVADDGVSVVARNVEFCTEGAEFGGAAAVAGRVLFWEGGIIGDLWQTDGTAAGTVRVSQDVRPADWYDGSPLIALRDAVYFAGSDREYGDELWRSDGTAEGTTLVKDIFPGSDSNGWYGNDSDPRDFAVANDTLFFSAADGVNGRELWKSDGTAAGTVLVKDIAADGSSDPQWLTNVNGTLYFSAGDSAGRGLWKSDGTEAGTVLVKAAGDLVPGASFATVANLTEVDGTLFFSIGKVQGATEPALCRSDGTPSGTVVVTDVSSAQLTSVNGVLYFARDDELWRSDGTGAGTTLVKDESEPTSLTNVNGTLFFTTDGGTRGLWRSDGTAEGTVLVTDVRLTRLSSGLTNVNGTLYFAVHDATNGTELWKSDGTGADTVLVRDINPGAASADPLVLAAVGDTLYFAATDRTHGRELWKTDGSAAGTVLVKDLETSRSYVTSDLVHAGGRLYFAGGDAATGSEVWTTDGEAPAVLARDIDPGPGDSSPSLFTDVNGTVFFAASDPVNGRELWRSDGTEAGTVLVKDLNPGAANSAPRSLANVAGVLYFAADDGVNGLELWRSDGTEAGTALVRDVLPGPVGSEPGNLTNAGGRLFFSAGDGVHRRGLWTSDGTADGTVLLREFGWWWNSGPVALTDVNGTLYFVASDYGDDGALWRSDGTAAGTVQLTDDRSAPAWLTDVNGTLFFTARSGRELWRSDGTADGTVLVHEVQEPRYPWYRSELTGLANVNGTLYFSQVELDWTPLRAAPVIDPARRSNISTGGQRHHYGTGLWTSNGTEAGTVFVAALVGVSFPTDVAGTLYFVWGAGLWRSRGSAAGTVEVLQLYDRPASLLHADSSLYFVEFWQWSYAATLKRFPLADGAVTPPAGTVGTVLEISATGLGPETGHVVLKVTSGGRRRTIALPVRDWSPTVIHASVPRGFGRPALCDVTVVPRKEPPQVFPAAFEFVAPTITGVSPGPIPPWAAGQTVTVRGMHFGTTPGTVRATWWSAERGREVTRRCEVISWPDAGPAEGPSEVTIRLPRRYEPSDSTTLILRNAVGSVAWSAPSR